MSVGDHTRFDREFDRRYAYGGCDLGAVCTPDRTVFKLWSPEASGVELFLYRHDTAGTNGHFRVPLPCALTGTQDAQDGAVKRQYYY